MRLWKNENQCGGIGESAGMRGRYGDVGDGEMETGETRGGGDAETAGTAGRARGEREERRRTVKNKRMLSKLSALLLILLAAAQSFLQKAPPSCSFTIHASSSHVPAGSLNHRHRQRSTASCAKANSPGQSC